MGGARRSRALCGQCTTQRRAGAPRRAARAHRTLTPFPPGAQYPGVALSADRTQGYGGDVAIDAPTRPRRPRRSDTLRAEARLAYAILGPTLLVITCLVAYPFCSAIYLSLQNKMIYARHETA